MKFKNLLNLTEQAPQPPIGKPAPMPSGTDQQPTNVGVNMDSAPTSEDPSEYDFTRDFRSFEDTKNKAIAAARKKLTDKLTKVLVGKKIIVNASRGYGQPKTDYTIENVKKVSVEEWYDNWVVIVTDDKDKKFFPTLGINVKIESPATDVNQSEEPVVDKSPESAKTTAPSVKNPEQKPNVEPSNNPDPQQKTASPNDPASGSTPQSVPQSDQKLIPTPQQKNEEEPNEEPPQTPVKKKRVPMAEVIESLLENILKKKINNKFINILESNDNFCEFEISSKIIENFDIRDFMLESKDYFLTSRSNRNRSFEIQKVGLNYRFTLKFRN